MASYTRQSSFSDGDTISASLFNNEYNQLVTAFSYSSSGTTGHRHDGTAAEGGNIHTIGDQDFLNKIVVDSSNNRWGVYVQVSGATVEQIRFQDGSIVPVTSNDIDLGTSSLQFKDLHIDGTASIDSLTLTSGSTVTVILDEDDLSTNSATALATQQSIKAYVDSQVTGQALTFSGDSGGSLSIDLDSEALTITGGTGIDTTGSTNDMSIAIDSTVATLTGSQTLTNKTLTSPDINGGTIDGATIGGSSAGNITYANLSDGTITITAFADEDDMSSNSATLVPTQQSVKAYVDSKVTAEDLDFQADSGGALSIDLDSETMTFTGGTGIDTSGSGNAVTFAIDSTVTTLAGTQTLTNKTLTTPVITSISNSGTVTLPSGNTTLVGTATSDVLTNKTISGSSNTLSNIGNSSLSNSSVSFGGISVALGSSDATPAFDLSDATGYTGDSSLVTTGTISSGVWQGTAVADTYVANDLTISGGTVNNTVIGGSSPAAADFTTVDTTGNATIGGNLAVTGNLTINGTTSTVNSTTVTIDDPIFTLGGDTTPSTDDNKDRGIEFKWHNGTGAKLGFFGYDDSASVFTFIPDASNTSEVFSGSAGNVAFGAISGTSFASTGNMTFGDDDKAIFGAGSDLQIYHDGSNSYVNDNGTGDLVLKTNGAGVQMWGGGDVMLNAVKDGAVSLYHDNAAKLATTASGIQVTGDISNTSGDLTIDVAGNIRLDADDNGEIRYLDGGTQYAAIKKDGNNALFQSIVADGDFIIQGIDGASFVSALTLDMSDAGAATFNSSVLVPHKIVHVGDTDTYLQFSAEDDWRVVTGNVERFSVNNSAVVINEESAALDFRVESNSNSHMLFVDGDTNRIGINEASPGYILDIKGGNGDQLRLNNGGEQFTQMYFQNNSSNIGAIWADNTGNKFVFYGYAGKGATIYSNATERVNFKSTGEVVFNDSGADYDFRVESDSNANMLFVDASTNRVGIGDSAPLSTVVVNGGRASEGVTAGGTYTELTRAGGGDLGLLFNKDTAKWLVGIDNSDGNAGPLRFEYGNYAASIHPGLGSGTTALALTYQGGITNTPVAGGHSVFNEGGVDADFRVESNNNASMLVVDASNDNVTITKAQSGSSALDVSNNSSNGSNVGAISTSLDSTSNNTNCWHLKSTTQLINSYYLYGDGSSSFTSDGRLKTDIVNLEDGYLEKFNTVRLVNFKWKAAPDSPAQMGVIAQEIEEIFPDLVSEDEDAIGTGETYKAVSYSKLNTIALKVIQELSAKVEILEARIAALES